MFAVSLAEGVLAFWRKAFRKSVHCNTDWSLPVTVAVTYYIKLLTAFQRSGTAKMWHDVLHPYRNVATETDLTKWQNEMYSARDWGHLARRFLASQNTGTVMAQMGNCEDHETPPWMARKRILCCSWMEELLWIIACSWKDIKTNVTKADLFSQVWCLWSGFFCGHNHESGPEQQAVTSTVHTFWFPKMPIADSAC